MACPERPAPAGPVTLFPSLAGLALGGGLVLLVLQNDRLREDVGPIALPLVGTAVTGRVFNLAGEPLAGVTVSNRGDSPRRVDGVTDAEGRFSLSGLSEGPAFVVAHAPGRRWSLARCEPGRDATIVLRSTDDPPEPVRPPSPEFHAARAELARRAAELPAEARSHLPSLVEWLAANPDGVCDALAQGRLPWGDGMTAAHATIAKTHPESARRVASFLKADARRARPNGRPGEGVRWRCIASAALYAVGDATTADVLLREAEDLLAASPDSDARGDVLHVWARYHLKRFGPAWRAADDPYHFELRFALPSWPIPTCRRPSLWPASSASRESRMSWSTSPDGSA